MRVRREQNDQASSDKLSGTDNEEVIKSSDHTRSTCALVWVNSDVGQWQLHGAAVARTIVAGTSAVAGREAGVASATSGPESIV